MNEPFRDELICPHCGQAIEAACEYEGCGRPAEFVAWFRGDGMIRRLNVCIECVNLSIGGESGKSKAIAAVSQ